MKMAPPTVVVTEPHREQLLTVQEFAGHMRVHPCSIYRLIRNGRQPGVVRVGRQIRINPKIAAAVSLESHTA
jgi:excisionase family DNA binding protein